MRKQLSVIYGNVETDSAGNWWYRSDVEGSNWQPVLSNVLTDVIASMSVDEKREALTTEMCPVLCNRIRYSIHLHQMGHYVKKHEPKIYMHFLNECRTNSIKVNSTGSSYFTFFSVGSQHVQGDTIEECLDKVIV